MLSVLSPFAFAVVSTDKPRWWRGEDSNLRSHFRRRVYSPLVLTTHPPLRAPGLEIPALLNTERYLEPTRGLEPITRGLQNRCSAS